MIVDQRIFFATLFTLRVSQIGISIELSEPNYFTFPHSALMERTILHAAQPRRKCVGTDFLYRSLVALKGAAFMTAPKRSGGCRCKAISSQQTKIQADLGHQLTNAICFAGTYSEDGIIDSDLYW